MARWAIISTEGIIVNVVEWDGPSTQWLPPHNHYVIQCDMQFGIGDRYDFQKKEFVINPDRVGITT